MALLRCSFGNSQILDFYYCFLVSQFSFLPLYFNESNNDIL